MSWMGISANGGRIQITEAEMSRWSIDSGRTFSVGWRNAYQFGEEEVSSTELRGARVVRASRDGKKHSEIAAEAGWADLAAMLAAAGF